VGFRRQVTETKTAPAFGLAFRALDMKKFLIDFTLKTLAMTAAAAFFFLPVLMGLQ
jgi:hypothetical protein